MAIPQPDGPITVFSDTTSEIRVVGNDDFISDETPLTVHLTGSAAGVIAENDHFIFDPSETNLTFVPGGQQSYGFMYFITNSQGENSSSASVDLTVVTPERPLLAPQPDHFFVDLGKVKQFNVLKNDGPLPPVATVDFQTIRGLTQDDLRGNFHFDPAGVLVGPGDKIDFTYTITTTTGEISNPVPVTLEVEAPSLPVARPDVEIIRSGEVLPFNVLSNDDIPAGVSVTSVSVTPLKPTPTQSSPTTPGLTPDNPPDNPGGSFHFDPAGFERANLPPDNVILFSYTITDSLGRTSNAAPVALVPLIARDDTVTVETNQVAKFGVLRNDTFTAARAVEFSPVPGLTPDNPSNNSSGLFLFDPTGVLQTPGARTSFSYTITDTAGRISEPANVTVVASPFTVVGFDNKASLAALPDAARSTFVNNYQEDDMKFLAVNFGHYHLSPEDAASFGHSAIGVIDNPTEQPRTLSPHGAGAVIEMVYDPNHDGAPDLFDLKQIQVLHGGLDIRVENAAHKTTLFSDLPEGVIPLTGADNLLSATLEATRVFQVDDIVFTPSAPARPQFAILSESQRLDPGLINGVDQAALTIGAGRDATITFQDEFAANQNVLGVYLIDPNGTIRDPKIVFARIEDADAVPQSPFARPGGGPLHAGDAVQLSELYAPETLEPGQKFGLFLVENGARLNPGFVFNGSGHLEFLDVSTGSPANVADDGSDLVLRHVATDGTVRTVQGAIVHTADNDSAPLANNLDPGGAEHVVSGVDGDGNFLIGFEDKADFDFNDLVIRLEAGKAMAPAARAEPMVEQAQAAVDPLSHAEHDAASEIVPVLGVESVGNAAHFAFG